MKKFVFTLCMLSISFAFITHAQSQTRVNSDSTEIIFEKTDHNYGVIKHRSNGTYEFVFKNMGKSPLIIRHVQSTCGCTVPEWDKQPIPPKGKGKIVVIYNTELIGSFIKTIKVFSNAKNSPVDLIIRGEVKI